MTLEDEVLVIKQTLTSVIDEINMLYSENYDIRDDVKIKCLDRMRSRLKLARIDCNTILL